MSSSQTIMDQNFPHDKWWIILGVLTVSYLFERFNVGHQSHVNQQMEGIPPLTTSLPDVYT
ncbi:hypothetical protein MUK42_06372 [Musa troglodytarum]|uniref:Uncharacterized protein n=1 Tax=Musa troglodytarum TaxID=320322 RepID=A0A9E7GLX7_9LILI|nr:hypothetical protein MUK42_06372 [Musa troglodytarum]